MATLTPQQAAALAQDIYLTQANQRSVENFYQIHDDILSQESMSSTKGTHGFRLINTRDTFGVCAAGINAFSDDVFLIFRGSTGANLGADWVSNGRLGLETGKTGCPVHIGFNHIFTSMLEEIKTFFKGRTPAVVHCVGHSLGGALATLAADWVSEKIKTQVKVYSFGAPRPATMAFSKQLTNRMGKQNIYRVYHESDPVSVIPVFPFFHAPFDSPGYFIRTGNVWWPWDHKMDKYRSSVKKHSWSSLSPTKDYEPTADEMDRWLEDDLYLNPVAPSTWRLLNSAIGYVIRKVLGLPFVFAQACFSGAVTLADKIACALSKAFKSGSNGGGPTNGASPVRSAGFWVLRLMRKILQVIGLNPAVNEEQLTRTFMRIALQKLIEKSNYQASRAVMGLTA